jgi:hypothetical protein
VNWQPQQVLETAPSSPTDFGSRQNRVLPELHGVQSASQMKGPLLRKVKFEAVER